MESKKKRVSLVLSSGGARGFAHIGAIEELEAQGYEIASIAGASMGALVGGMYAAGKLQEVKDRIVSLNVRDMFSLIDLSLSLNHVVKGDKVIQALREIVPDVNIEDLPVRFCAVATDIKNHREVVFDRGSLYDAIRASISIPSFFKPVKASDGGVLIDGGVVNPLPLNRVGREPGDLLVAVNVSAPSNNEVDDLRRQALQLRKKGALLGRLIPNIPRTESNYVTLLSKTFSMMVEQNTALSLQITPPDVLVNLPMNRFGGFDYDKAKKIIKFGRSHMRDALSEYWQATREAGFFRAE